jgi:predicted AAA+ superfamily ATPase
MKLSETPHSIFLVSGPVQAGKTTFLSSLVTLLERGAYFRRGVPMSGHLLFRPQIRI